MKKIFFIALLVLIPGMACGSTANDFQVNNQSTYAVPPGSTKVLILDLTLPDAKLNSIKIFNAGTVQQYNLSKISIYEDGPSPGWDGDESERVRKSSSPFFDTELAGDFSNKRIFVTVDINSDTYSGKTIKPELATGAAVFSDASFNGPTDEKVVGFERIILAGTNTPSVPFSPTAKNGEAVSTSTIRWYFTDASNNEFGFKILDSNSKTVARKEESNLSYLDETGLNSDTEYSGRRVAAFNDRGESMGSTLAVFPAVRTLAEQKTAPVEQVAPEPVPAEPIAIQEVKKEPSLFETIQIKIAEIQRQINELIIKLNEFIRQSSATVFGALQGFLRAFFGK
ncbi:MAG: hypothetical protein ABIG29_00735 [Candidatus Nealsonbacteria bacterium]